MMATKLGKHGGRTGELLMSSQKSWISAREQPVIKPKLSNAQLTVTFNTWLRHGVIKGRNSARHRNWKIEPVNF